MLDRIVAGASLVVALGLPAVIVGQSRIEYNSMFVDTAARIGASNQLRRNFKHSLMLDHELVSGIVIAKSEPMKASYQGMEFSFIPYTIKTNAGEIYNGVSREQDILNVGDVATALLGWAVDCEAANCGFPYRIIEAYQKMN